MASGNHSGYCRYPETAQVKGCLLHFQAPLVVPDMSSEMKSMKQAFQERGDDCRTATCRIWKQFLQWTDQHSRVLPVMDESMQAIKHDLCQDAMGLSDDEPWAGLWRVLSSWTLRQWTGWAWRDACQLGNALWEDGSPGPDA